MEDEEMIGVRALRAGDMDGLEALVRLHQLQAMRVAYNLCGNTQLAEDVVSEAFLAVHRHIRSYDSSRPFGPWFYRIVVNAMRKALREQTRIQFATNAEGILRNCSDPHPTPETQAIYNELNTIIAREVIRLSKKQREVTVLRYYLAMDERTMAETLRIPIGTVKWRLHSARKALLHRINTTQELSTYFYQEGKTREST